MALLARALLVEFPQYRDYFKHPGDPDRRRGAEELQPAARALSRRDRHEDRLHLRLRLQPRRLREARRPRADRRRLRRVRRQGAGRARRRAARRGLSLRRTAGASRGRRSPTSPRARPTPTPLDMRPYVCGPQRADRRLRGERRTAPAAGGAQVSHLELPPIYLGPPVAGRRAMRAGEASSGEPGFVARMPRPRPRCRDAVRRRTPSRPTDDGDSAPPARGDRRGGRQRRRPLADVARNSAGRRPRYALLDLEAQLVALAAAGEQPMARPRCRNAACRSPPSDRWRARGSACRPDAARMRRAVFSTGSGHFSPRTSMTTASSIRRSSQHRWPALALPRLGC